MLLLLLLLILDELLLLALSRGELLAGGGTTPAYVSMFSRGGDLDEDDVDVDVLLGDDEVALLVFVLLD